jgi:pseudaminic acid cytidylyltransferase
MNIAVIPARGGSKRIPGKNIRNFLGKPIIAYSIEAALNTKLFDEVIVSTDDAEIAEVAENCGATVPFMRPEELADDFSTIIDVLKNVVEWYEKLGQKVDQLCCIYATAPFVTPEVLKEGYESLTSSVAGCAMSVAAFTYPIQRALEVGAKGTLEMINKEHLLTRSQDLPEAYMDAAQFIWARPEAIKDSTISLLEKGVIPVVIPTSRVQDIDTLEDWSRAELIYRVMQATEEEA